MPNNFNPSHMALNPSPLYGLQDPALSIIATFGITHHCNYSYLLSFASPCLLYFSKLWANVNHMLTQDFLG